jgi:hypothetical protein
MESNENQIKKLEIERSNYKNSVNEEARRTAQLEIDKLGKEIILLDV